MMKRLIGVCGKAGAGKDTVGKYLVSNYGYQSYAFASGMRRAVEAMFDIPLSTLEDRKKKEEVVPWIGLSPRRLMQLLGTEYGRNLVHEDIWIRHMIRRWELLPDNCAGMVITDVRFDNEASAVTQLGGTLVEIVRETDAPVLPAHASEAGVHKRFNRTTIRNEGPKEFLYDMLDSWMDGKR